MNKYQIGHITPWWGDSFKSLDYEYIPLTDVDQVNTWLKQGYNKIYLGGGQYSMAKTMPEYAKPFLTMFDWENVGINFFRMLTCEALPLHVDKFNKYREIAKLKDNSSIQRSIVFLEDWKSGHYFEIDGVAHLNWHKGDYVIWDADIEHFAGNFGIDPRYTMQITGTKRS
jgi:hypothetical protein